MFLFLAFLSGLSSLVAGIILYRRKKKMFWKKKAQQIAVNKKPKYTTNEEIYRSASSIYEVSQKMWEGNPWARGVIKYYITFAKDIRQWKDEQEEIEQSEN